MSGTLIVTLFISFFVFLVAFLGIGLRVFLKKDKEFRGTCASASPAVANEIGECSICGGDPNKCDTKSS